MASIGEQRRRVHEPPRCALRACKKDVCPESDERYATASVTFSVVEWNELRPAYRSEAKDARTSFLECFDQPAAVIVIMIAVFVSVFVSSKNPMGMRMGGRLCVVTAGFAGRLFPFIRAVSVYLPPHTFYPVISMLK